MIHWLHKKFVPFILTLIFSVVGFGAFVNTANADIISDLSYILPLDVKYLPGPGRVADIPQPPSLTASQAQTILVNIKNDGLVQSSFRRILNAVIALDIAQSNYDRNILCSSATISVPGVCPEGRDLLTAKDELDLAISELESALVLARERQDLTIQSFQAQNAVTEALNTGTKRITDTAQERQTSLSEQGQADIAGTTPVEFTPEYINAARQAQKNASAWNTDDTIALKMQQDCVVWAATKATNLMPCVAEVVYKLIYKPTAYALMGAGYIFDETLSLSIEGDMVSPPFISTTWVVVRDFSNMLFIFILLYTGIMTIFGATDWRKTVLQVVFIALIINFSLFFTKVVIDAGNVLAVGVKSAISTTSVSEGLAAAFQPQQFLSAATKGPDTSGGDAIIVFLIAAVVSGFAAYVFFKAALLFIGRLIAFWFLMIVSPFAFISTALPKGNKFQEWLNTLISQAFVAPVFLFFIYLIMKVISSGTGILGGFAQTGDWFKDLLGPVIVATLLVLALQQALKFATDMAGSFGKLGSDMAGKVIGTAVGVAGGVGGIALSGAGLVGRATVGRYAQSVQEKGTFQRMATEGGALGKFVGRQGINLTDKARTGTWDARGVGLVQKALKKADIPNVGKPGEGAKGGYEGSMKRQDEADKAFAKKLKVTEKEKENVMGYTKEKVEMSKAVVEEKTSAVTKAKNDVEKAQVAFNNSLDDPELAKVLKEAEDKQIEAAAALTKATKELKVSTEEEAEAVKKIATEDARRRGSYAEYMVGRTNIAGTGIYGVTYSHPQAERSAKKIRGTTVKDEEAKENADKDASKVVKKLMEDAEKAKGHVEPAPVAEPKTPEH